MADVASSLLSKGVQLEAAGLVGKAMAELVKDLEWQAPPLHERGDRLLVVAVLAELIQKGAAKVDDPVLRVNLVDEGLKMLVLVAGGKAPTDGPKQQ